MKKEYNGQSKRGGVYQIRNLENGKIYIGSAKCFQVRANQHQTQLLKQKHHNRHLQASWNKHGEDAFLFEVLEVVDGDKLERTAKEKEYLKKFYENWEQCYNFQRNPLSNDQSCWSKNPEKTRKKISEANKKNWANPIFRERMEKVFSKPEFKKMKAISMKPYYEQQKETLDKYRHIALQKSKEKQIKHYGKILDPNGQVFEVTNLQQFSKEKSLDRTNLQKVIMGDCPSYKGWRQWKKELEKVPYKSNKSHRQKLFSIMSPDGIIYTGKNITQFCLEHNLRKENITAVINGRRKSHKGWRNIKHCPIQKN